MWANGEPHFGVATSEAKRRAKQKEDDTRARRERRGEEGEVKTSTEYERESRLPWTGKRTQFGEKGKSLGVRGRRKRKGRGKKRRKSLGGRSYRVIKTLAISPREERDRRGPPR